MIAALIISLFDQILARSGGSRQGHGSFDHAPDDPQCDPVAPMHGNPSNPSGCTGDDRSVGPTALNRAIDDSVLREYVTDSVPDP